MSSEASTHVDRRDAEGVEDGVEHVVEVAIEVASVVASVVASEVTDPRGRPQTEYDVARGLVDRLTGRRVPRPQGQEGDTDAITIGHLCPRCGSGSHGPLIVHGAPLWASLSRSGDTTVVAVTDAGPVGVDLEHADAADSRWVREVALHPMEHVSDRFEATQLWVRKESLAKATGAGLRADLKRVHLTPSGHSPALIRWDPMESCEAGADPACVWMTDFRLGVHVGCVTVLAERPPRVIVRPPSC